MKIVESVLVNNDCYKGGRKITPKGLMLHSVGCAQPNAQVFIKNWNNPGVEKCVHAFIDGITGTIYQTLPWNHRGWHAGTGTTGKSANNTHIGVEMCEPSGIKYTDGATFIVTDKNEAIKSATITYYSAVELFAYLCKTQNLEPTRDIISHSEGYKLGIASNHGDPVHLWKQLDLDFTMDTFREDVRKEMVEDKKEIRYNKLTDVPQYAYEAIKYYMDIGALNGNERGKLDLSNDMLRTLVITYRAFVK